MFSCSKYEKECGLQQGAAVRLRVMGYLEFGTVSRCYRNGRYDVQLEDGSVEKGVEEDALKLVTGEWRPRHDQAFRAGDKVEHSDARDGRGSWREGEVVRDNRDGTYDIKLRNGALVTDAREADLRRTDLALMDDVRGARQRYFDGARRPAEGKYRKGDAAACCWYRPENRSQPRRQGAWRKTTVLAFHGDGTYSVEFQDGQIEEDVPEDALLPEEDAEEELRKGYAEAKGSAGRRNDGWDDVEAFAVDMWNHGGRRGRKPSLSAALEEPEDLRRIEDLLGREMVDGLRDAFETVDRQSASGGYLDVSDCVKAFQRLGRRCTQHEVVAWCRRAAAARGEARSLRSLGFIDFCKAFCFCFCMRSGPLATDKEQRGATGRVLGLKGYLEGRGELDDEAAELERWAARLGERRMLEIEDVWRARATPLRRSDGSQGQRKGLRVYELRAAFLDLGVDVSASMLKQYLYQLDLTPTDSLGLCEFAFVFHALFKQGGGTGISTAPASTTETQAPGLGRREDGRMLTVAAVAARVGQEEPWVGTRDQHAALVRRLCIGRSPALCKAIRRIADAFEDRDGGDESDSQRSVPASHVSSLLNAAALSTSRSGHLGKAVATLLQRMDDEHLDRVDLRYLFEALGPALTATLDDRPTVPEAFAKLRLHCPPDEVRVCGATVLACIDNVLKGEKGERGHREPAAVRQRTWRLQKANPNFQARVGRLPGGVELMRAVGFCEPGLKADGGGGGGEMSKLVLEGSVSAKGRAVERLPAAVVGALRERKEAVQAELDAMQGVPSVAAAVREVRLAHSARDTRRGVETALLLVSNVLRAPGDLRRHRTKVGNPNFHQSLGRLRGSGGLMLAIGFELSADEALYVLNCNGDPTGGPADDGESGTASFRFPKLDRVGERFLARRKAELEAVLKELDVAIGRDEHVDSGASEAKGNRSDALREGKAGARARGRGGFGGADAAAGASGRVRAREVDDTLREMLRGKAPAHKAHLKLLSSAFDAMKDLTSGVVTADSLRSYWRSVERVEGPDAAYAWIAARDTTADGTVTLEEYAASFCCRLLLPSSASDMPALDLLKGGTDAQRRQRETMRRAFERLCDPVHKVITAESLRRAWQSTASDKGSHAAAEWIDARDYTSDGRVTLREFVASYGALMQPVAADHIARPEDDGASELAAAFGALRLFSPPRLALRAGLWVQQRLAQLLAAPSAKHLWVVRKDDAEYHEAVGRRFGGDQLLVACGFLPNAADRTLTLHAHAGVAAPPRSKWALLPSEVQAFLRAAKEELAQRLRGLDGDGLALPDLGAVSVGVGRLRGEGDVTARWATCIETLKTYCANVLRSPHDDRVRAINMANAVFRERICSVPGGVEALVALGWREDPDSSMLTLPEDADLTHLAARMQELDGGLAPLRRAATAAKAAGRKDGASGGGRDFSEDSTRRGGELRQAPRARRAEESGAKGGQGAKRGKGGRGPPATSGGLRKAKPDPATIAALPITARLAHDGDAAGTAAEELRMELDLRKSAEAKLRSAEEDRDRLRNQLEEMTLQLSSTLSAREAQVLASMHPRERRVATEAARTAGRRWGAQRPRRPAERTTAPSRPAASQARRGMAKKAGPAAGRVGGGRLTGAAATRARWREPYPAPAAGLRDTVAAGAVEVPITAGSTVSNGMLVRIGTGANAELAWVVNANAGGA